uniref:Uncharacterized protein n=1 Tax=Lotharella globosa TaxID=91324 RepID=A0A7S3YU56_9EUKA
MAIRQKTLKELKKSLFLGIIDGDFRRVQRTALAASRKCKDLDARAAHSSSSRQIVLSSEDGEELHPNVKIMRGPQGLTLMETACRYGRLTIAKWLRNSGVSTRGNPDQTKKHHPSPSTNPGNHGNASGNPRDSQRWEGWTPLHHACDAKRFMVAAWLVTEGGAYGDSDREATDKVTTPRSLGLESLLQTAKRSKQAQDQLHRAKRRRKEQEDQREAQRIVAEAKRRRLAATWPQRLQLEIERDNRVMGHQPERWFERLWGDLGHEFDRKYAMNSKEWAEFIKAQQLLNRSRKALVVNETGRQGGGWRGQSRKVGPPVRWEGQDETFLEVEERWKSFESDLREASSGNPSLTLRAVPFPTSPPEDNRAPPPEKFGYRDIFLRIHSRMYAHWACTSLNKEHERLSHPRKL